MSMGKMIGWVTMVALGTTAGFFGKDWSQGNFSFDAFSYVRPAGAANSKRPEIKPAQTFAQNFRSIQQDYVEKLDPRELKHAAMEGLVSSLGDPHTVFMAPDLTEAFSKETQGASDFVGIGARLNPDPQGARMMSVFDGSPAAGAGMKPGDLIIKVNDKSVGGQPVDQIVRQIRGVEGTLVKVTVLRAPEDGGPLQEKSFSVKRGKVIAPTADGFYLPESKIGYITVYQFAQNTAEQFAKKLDQMENSGAKGYVIDLRGNPGGLLETATVMLSEFVSNKRVVTMKRRDGEENEVKTYSDLRRDQALPVAILVNEESASASEIFAGVMRDYRLATLIGEHTYGKSSVQNLYYLPDGSSAKVTIAKYFLPSGYDIMRKVDEEGQYVSGGLKPDLEVPLNLGPRTVVGDPKRDNQLQRAIQVVQSKL